MTPNMTRRVGEPAMKFAQQQHEAFLAELRQYLDTLRLADLRGAARSWGWAVRGNTKADVVEATLAYLADASRMSATYATLPARTRSPPVVPGPERPHRGGPAAGRLTTGCQQPA